MNKSEKKRAQERVAIAKDALAWEKAGALVVGSGSYINPIEEKNYLSKFRNTEGLNKQARDVVLGKCRVCALGGLLLAKAVRFDAVTVRDILETKMVRLTDHFSPDQLNEIEAAFEGESYNLNTSIMSHNVENDTWLEKYPDAAERFRAIMQNIIDNDGTFVP